MTDNTWTLHLETETGTETVDVAKDNATPDLEPALEIATQIQFSDRVGDFEGNYQTFEPYLRAPKTAVAKRGETEYGLPWFREHYHPDDYPVGSLLIGVEPGSDIYLSDGWWGLLVGGEVITPNVGGEMTAIVVETEWFVLGAFDDYAEHDDVRDAYSDTINSQ